MSEKSHSPKFPESMWFAATIALGSMWPWSLCKECRASGLVNGLTQYFITIDYPYKAPRINTAQIKKDNLQRTVNGKSNVMTVFFNCHFF